MNKETIKATKKQVDVPATVARAIIISRRIKNDTVLLDELKATLRDVARDEVDRRGGGEEMVELDSPEGRATVSFVSPVLKLVKGADPQVLQHVLPEQVWDDLFEVKATLTSGFAAQLELVPLTKVQREKVLRLVEWTTPEPRVTLPK